MVVNDLKFHYKEIWLYTTFVIFTFLAKYIFLKQYLIKSTFMTPDSDDYIEISRDFPQIYISKSESDLKLTLMRLPGYPLFLSIFQNTQLLISAQIVLGILMGIISILVLKNILKNYQPKIGLLAYLLIQVETSLFVYSYRIMSDMLFSFALLGFVFLITFKRQSSALIPFNLLAIGFLFTLYMIRPVAITMTMVFLMMVFLSKERKKFIALSMISISILVSYSIFNYSKSGILTYTTLQNSNILFYEGVGALDASSSKNLLSLKQQDATSKSFLALFEKEDERRQDILGKAPTIKSVNDYNLNRGLDLILDNKVGFFKLHFVGVIKVLFGPNRSEIFQIITDDNRIIMGKTTKYLILAMFFTINSLIVFFGLLGFFKYFFLNNFTKVSCLTIITLTIISSSALAYGRFRTPMSPFFIIFACLFLSKSFQNFGFRYILKILFRR